MCERLISCYSANCNGAEEQFFGIIAGGDGLSITLCTFLGCCLVVGGCVVDILCGCCLDLQTSAQWFCLPHFCRMCSSTIATRRPDGFNRIHELVPVCAVFVLNIFQFPELYYGHFIATAQLHGVLEC